MKKILIWYNKDGQRYWDVSTIDLELRAFLSMFKTIDALQYYVDLNAKQSVLYNKALEGDSISAKKLIILRSKYEYEGWTIEEVK